VIDSSLEDARLRAEVRWQPRCKLLSTRSAAWRRSGYSTGCQRRPSPPRPWCISPCFRFPLFSKKIQIVWKIFSILLCFSTFPPVKRKLLFPPYFTKFPPCFTKIHLLFTYFLCISFPPCFDHDAFMHRPMHVLDAPAGCPNLQSTLQVWCRDRIMWSNFGPIWYGTLWILSTFRVCFFEEHNFISWTMSL